MFNLYSNSELKIWWHDKNQGEADMFNLYSNSELKIWWHDKNQGEADD